MARGTFLVTLTPRSSMSVTLFPHSFRFCRIPILTLAIQARDDSLQKRDGKRREEKGKKDILKGACKVLTSSKPCINLLGGT